MSYKALMVAVSIAMGLSINFEVHADAYTCAKKVVADGWLKKYEYLGNTWGANTKKSGSFGSSSGSTTENSTASFDPGVTTGKYQSTTQYSSSWGECSMLEMYITRQMREDYIEQNHAEIKKQIAQGDGHHLESLAFLSGCSQVQSERWKGTLRAKAVELIEAELASDWSDVLDQSIESDPELKSACSA